MSLSSAHLAKRSGSPGTPTPHIESSLAIFPFKLPSFVCGQMEITLIYLTRTVTAEHSGGAKGCQYLLPICLQGSGGDSGCNLGWCSRSLLGLAAFKTVLGNIWGRLKCWGTLWVK